MTEEELLKKIEKAKKEILAKLNLSGNGIEFLPKEIGNLSNLTMFSISRNKLTEVPVELGKISELRYLGLGGNSLIDPHQEIVEQGTEVVLDYLRAKGRGQKKQWTSKLVVVGQGGVGKT